MQSAQLAWLSCLSYRSIRLRQLNQSLNLKNQLISARCFAKRQNRKDSHNFMMICNWLMLKMKYFDISNKKHNQSLQRIWELKANSYPPPASFPCLKRNLPMNGCFLICCVYGFNGKGTLNFKDVKIIF